MLGTLDEIYANTPFDARDPRRRRGCSRPIDLQAVKAAGVTFAVSMIERVIEERVRGDMDAAAELRDEIRDEDRHRPSRARARIASAPRSSRSTCVAEGLW